VAAGSFPGVAAPAAVAKPVEGLRIQGPISISLARAASAGLCLGWPVPAQAAQTLVQKHWTEGLPAGAPLLLAVLLPSAAGVLPSRGNAQDNHPRPELPEQ